MSDKEWFAVKDVDGLVTSARTLVYNNFGDWKSKDEQDIVDSMILKPDNEDEFDQLLTQEESMVIVQSLLKRQRHKTTKKVRYLISDSLFYDILQQLNDRLVSNTIASLVQKGLVESAYDSDIDDFVFWVKQNDSEKPETD
jgi:hypothetical protein